MFLYLPPLSREVPSDFQGAKVRDDAKAAMTEKKAAMTEAAAGAEILAFGPRAGHSRAAYINERVKAMAGKRIDTAVGSKVTCLLFSRTRLEMLFSSSLLCAAPIPR